MGWAAAAVVAYLAFKSGALDRVLGRAPKAPPPMGSPPPPVGQPATPGYRYQAPPGSQPGNSYGDRAYGSQPTDGGLGGFLGLLTGLGGAINKAIGADGGSTSPASGGKPSGGATSGLLGDPYGTGGGTVNAGTGAAAGGSADLGAPDSGGWGTDEEASWFTDEEESGSAGW